MLGRCYLCNKEFQLNEEQEKDFIENLNYQYFCSNECQSKHKDIMNQLISQVQEEDENNLNHKCYYCGKEFILSPYQKYKIKQNPNHKCYCSKECQNEASKKKIIYNCNYCGKEFILSRNQQFLISKNPSHKCFCSRKCQNEAKKLLLNYICPQCNKKFILNKDQRFVLKKNIVNMCFCSPNCRSKYVISQTINKRTII